MVYLIVTAAAVWLAQRLLAMRQAMEFRKQFAALRRDGRDVAVGAAKKLGRRVYVAVSADRDGRVVECLVLRGVTVFARGRDETRLVGGPVADLAAGPVDAAVPPMVASAAQQAAGFVAAAQRKRAGLVASQKRRTAAPAAR